MNGSRAPVAAALLSALLLTGFATLAANNLGYRGMWWDEAAQFWISQGLSNYSPPFATRQGLVEVARMNARENLDPGGFSALLHLWTVGSRGLVWLRLLPFAFFVLGVVALGMLGWRLTRSWLFAVASGAVAALYPAALYFGLEIRAYSMEMAGVAIGALLLAAAVERPSVARAAALGLACAAFLTSRYSFALAAVALLVALWRSLAGRVDRRALRAYLVAAGAPAAVTGIAIATLMLSHQLWPEMRAGLGIVSPVYTRRDVLRFASDPLGLLARNLVSPAALPITLAVVVFVALARRRADRTRPEPAAGSGATVRLALLGFVAVLQALSAVVSLLGLYPWDIAGRWSAYLVALSAVAAVTLAAEVRSRVLAGGAPPGVASPGRRRMQFIATAVAVLVTVAAAGRAALHRQAVASPWQTREAQQIEALPRTSLPPGSVFVTHYEVPIVRYLYEYGPDRGRAEYPGAFRFETNTEFRTSAPIAAADEGVAFVITGLPLAKARSRFPGSTLRPYGPPGSRLLAVLPAGGVGTAPPR